MRKPLRELAASLTTDPPQREVAAIARALHSARIEAIEDEGEREFARMLGSYGEDYEKAPLVLAALIEEGWVIVWNLLVAGDKAEAPSALAGKAQVKE